MSWTERELKKRAAGSRAAIAEISSAESESAKVRELWARFEEGNRVLPDALQLTIDSNDPAPTSEDGILFLTWLRAPNGAALGFSGEAIRYVWPEKNHGKSNNFWIRWSGEQQHYELSQRVSITAPPRFARFRFDERRVEYMIKCLVVGNRIKVKSVLKSRLWPF